MIFTKMAKKKAKRANKKSQKKSLKKNTKSYKEKYDRPQMNIYDDFAELRNINWAKVFHSILYYCTAILSVSLFIFSIIQGYFQHAKQQYGLAFMLYLFASLFFIVAYSSFRRGKRHFHFHEFPEDNGK